MNYDDEEKREDGEEDFDMSKGAGDEELDEELLDDEDGDDDDLDEPFDDVDE